MDFGTLNSASKYPSIPTYHEIDPANGLLRPTAVNFPGNIVVSTEKVNGTSGRIVFTDDGDWFIGSREELLYARIDRIINPALSIVPVLKPLAERLAAEGMRPNPGLIRVIFAEVYGKGIGGAWKQYTAPSAGNTGYRLFDVAHVEKAVLEWPRERISGWRERGGQNFLSEPGLLNFAKGWQIPLVPRLGDTFSSSLPRDLEGMEEFLKTNLVYTQAALDGGALGRPEGIVFRNVDRSVIAKARFEDYQRTLHPQPQRKGRKQ